MKKNLNLGNSIFGSWRVVFKCPYRIMSDTSLSGKRVQKCTHWPEGSQMSLQRAVEANRVFVGTMKKTKSTDNGVVNTIC